MFVWNCWFFVHPFIHQSIHSVIHPTIHSFIHSLTHSFIHPSIRSFVRWYSGLHVLYETGPWCSFDPFNNRIQWRRHFPSLTLKNAVWPHRKWCILYKGFISPLRGNSLTFTSSFIGNEWMQDNPSHFYRGFVACFNITQINKGIKLILEERCLRRCDTMRDQREVRQLNCLFFCFIQR